MTAWWNKLRAALPSPHPRPDVPRSPQLHGYPSTFTRSGGGEGGVPRVNIFDPALKQYRSAFRPGDPALGDVAAAARWRDARRRAMEHVLRLIVTSPWRENLVLRGSLLMRAWFGDAAREPGDLDWTILPETIGVADAWAAEFFTDLVGRIAVNQSIENSDIQFGVKGIATDDIWTYDRAPGKRIVVPWLVPGLPVGAVQCDFVFGEALPTPPVETTIPAAAGEAIVARTADLQSSLAWKILWLQTDMYPQGKDLYDAVLLAEHATLPYDVLMATLRRGGEFRDGELEPDFAMKWTPDWANFLLEYPHVGGEAKQWQERLTRALAPTFANAPPPPGPVAGDARPNS